jgi:hypothetical protein
VRQLKLLQEENTRLKKLVAELTLDKAMLTDVLQKTGVAATSLSGQDSAENPLNPPARVGEQPAGSSR